LATPVLSQPRRKLLREIDNRRTAGIAYVAALISLLTLAALAIHGFHPYAEDGGLYLTGIKRMLDPTLYEASREFVLGHIRFSLFAPGIAWVVRGSGLPLMTVVLLVHLASIWLTLFAAWMLTGRCFGSVRERTSAVCLLAVWLTLPVAGTSLMVMDPYVTARSISTPLTLFALVGAIDFLRSTRRGERWAWGSLGLTAGTLIAAAAVHPLMAGYGFCCVLAMGTAAPRTQRMRLAAVAALGTAAFAGALFLRLQSTAEPTAYRAVALSRYYWFLERWHWYELAGAFAPLAIFAVVRWRDRNSGVGTSREIAWMAVVAGAIAMVVAALFARVNAATYLVARMQPMRIFQPIYILMILFVGAALSHWLKRSAARWAITFAVLAGVMIMVERRTFPSSGREELPMMEGQTRNGWVEAFDWIRLRTPKDALFALDADYITKPGEDAQSFRAIAERSVLPDYSKDGGEAAITPWLTESWTSGQEAQVNLSGRTDAQRLQLLTPKGVSWIVLEAKAETGFACVFANAAVKVCRLPGTDQAGGDGLRVSLRQPVLPAASQPPAQR